MCFYKLQLAIHNSFSRLRSYNKKPNYLKGNVYNDYGSGFYCTVENEMSKEWTCKNGTDVFSNRYSLNSLGLKVLNLLDGNHSVLNWIALLLKYRTFRLDSEIAIDAKDYIIQNFSINLSQYDAVIGYRADDSYFSYAESFEERSPEYWAGWVLAEYQWYACCNFAYIFDRVKLSEIIEMYPLFHEMDINHFIASMNKKCSNAERGTSLKILREASGLSQTELASRSGVNLRSIQMYEQRGNSIDKAQSGTLFKLARILRCSIEDFLENPQE